MVVLICGDNIHKDVLSNECDKRCISYNNVLTITEETINKLNPSHVIIILSSDYVFNYSKHMNHYNPNICFMYIVASPDVLMNTYTINLLNMYDLCNVYESIDASVDEICNNNIPNFAFFILRHVSKEKDNILWINCYQQIRHFYDDPIIIIDDNSDQSLVSLDINLINCTIIQSEFPGRGELLPYYYMFHNKLCKKGIMLHDSSFIIKRIDFSKYTMDMQPLWTAVHDWDDVYRENAYIKQLYNSNSLLHFYKKKNNWNVCFGAMSVVSYKFLQKLHIKYNIFNLLHIIRTRRDRMTFERIIGMLAYKEIPSLYSVGSILGDMGNDGHIPWKYSIEQFIVDKSNNFIDISDNIRVLKCFVGR